MEDQLNLNMLNKRWMQEGEENTSAEGSDSSEGGEAAEAGEKGESKSEEEELAEIKKEYYQDIEYMLFDFNVIFYLSVPYYLFPVHYMLRVFFEVMTKRFDASSVTPIHLCEFSCFIILIFWELEKKKLQQSPINDLDKDEDFNIDQFMIVTIIREVQEFKVYF
jgi:hypothetical protein